AKREAACGNESIAIRKPKQVLQGTAGKKSGRDVRKRLPEGITGALNGQCVSAVEFTGSEGVRSRPGAEEQLREVQHGPVWFGMFAGAAPGGGGREVHRSDDGVYSVPELG